MSDRKTTRPGPKKLAVIKDLLRLKAVMRLDEKLKYLSKAELDSGSLELVTSLSEESVSHSLV